MAPSRDQLVRVAYNKPASCRVRVQRYSKVLHNHERDTYTYREGVDPLLKKYIPPERLIFSEVTHEKKHKPLMVENPFIKWLPEDPDFEKYKPAVLNNEVAFKDIAKYLNKSDIPLPHDMWVAYKMFLSMMECHITSFDSTPLSDVIAEINPKSGVGWPHNKKVDPVTKIPPISKRHLLEDPEFMTFFLAILGKTQH